MAEGCPNSDLLCEFAGQRLPEETATELESHLEACRTCREYLEVLKSLESLGSELEQPPAAAGGPLRRAR